MNRDFVSIRTVVRELVHVLPEKLRPTFGRRLSPRGELEFEDLGLALFELAFYNAGRTIRRKDKHSAFTFTDDPLGGPFMYTFHVTDTDGITTYLTAKQCITPDQSAVLFEIHISCEHGDAVGDRDWMEVAHRHYWRYDTEPTPSGVKEAE